MFHRFVFLGAAVLALLWTTTVPGAVQAQHARGGSGSGFHGGSGRFNGGFGRSFGGFDRGFDRRFFDPRFGRFDRDFDLFVFPGIGGVGAPVFFGGF